MDASCSNTAFSVLVDAGAVRRVATTDFRTIRERTRGGHRSVDRFGGRIPYRPVRVVERFCPIPRDCYTVWGRCEHTAVICPLQPGAVLQGLCLCIRLSASGTCCPIQRLPRGRFRNG